MSQDGLRKKFNLIELEVILIFLNELQVYRYETNIKILQVSEIRTEKENFIEELLQLRSSVKELQAALNLDRSKRLKLMHQNETLQKTNEELLEQNTASVAGNYLRIYNLFFTTTCSFYFRRKSIQKGAV